MFFYLLSISQSSVSAHLMLFVVVELGKSENGKAGKVGIGKMPFHNKCMNNTFIIRN